MLLDRLSRQQHHALFVLLSANLPVEVFHGDSAKKTKQFWNYELLRKIAAELDVRESNIFGCIPLVTSSAKFRDLEWEKRELLAQPCIQYLRETNVSLIKIYTEVLIFLVEEDLFDGRGRVLMRNLLRMFQLQPQDGIWIENQVSVFLIAEQGKVAHARETKKNRYRYVKIGAVALGAGAILAVTGGLVSIMQALNYSFFVLLKAIHFLFSCIHTIGNIDFQAAPAVAGALLLMGSSAATAASVAGGMAMFFGGTGAGLAGYKMIKRTRGLTDFEFQQYDEKVCKSTVRSTVVCIIKVLAASFFH